MKVLELFAGSRSIGKTAESLGMEVFSVDINNFENINLVKDILHLKKYTVIADLFIFSCDKHIIEASWEDFLTF